MKKVLAGLAVAAVVAVVAVVVLGRNLGRVVKAGIETLGPRFTGTAVTVEAVELSPSTGEGTLRGLVVGNPAPYREPFAFRLGEASVVVDPATVMSEKVVVKSVRVVGPEVVLEGGLGESNLQEILANLTRFADSEKSRPAGEAGAGRKLQVDEVVLSGTRVTVRLNLPGLGSAVPPLTLPDLRLSGLGSGPEGITAGEMTRQVLGAVVKQVLPAVAARVAGLPKDLGGAAKGAVDKAAGAIKDAASKGLDTLFRKDR